MALITISGYPCSGKTRRADQIKRALEKRLQDPNYAHTQLKVSILSDDTLNVSRASYNDSRSEKPTRAALFTAMQRQMSPDTILIVDSLNYIKGFRYQMHCAAREFRLRVCTVYVVAKPELCREWNSCRPKSLAYLPETLENLIARFEEPSSMVRWDSPLFSILWTDEDVDIDGLWLAVTEGTVKPPNVGTQAVQKAPPDALQTLEQTVASMVSAILKEQTVAQSVGGTVTLLLSATLKPRITLPARHVTTSELQRLKRRFVMIHKKAVTLGTTEKGPIDWNDENIAEKFTMYLQENW